MKTAIVLYGDLPMLLRQGGEINRLLADVSACLSGVELWLFHKGRQPDILPEFSGFVSSVVFLSVENPQLPESFLFLLEQVCNLKPVDLLAFDSSGLGEELATRLAFRLKGSSCLRVENCRMQSGQLEVSRPAYGNILLAKFKLHRKPYCLSAAKTTGDPLHKIGYGHLPVQSLTLKQLKCHWQKKISITPDMSEKGLAHADIVLALGLGIKSKKNMDLLKDIADTMGAKIGASRPVVMNAWADMSQLIGASGLILSPKICIAAGVSGAGVFSVGIKNSGLVLAINTDRDAPIFHIADMGIIDDLFAVLLALQEIILFEKEKYEKKISNGSGCRHPECKSGYF